MARRILWASLALAPATIALDYLAHLGNTALFVLAAIALIPLAWLIGEATEHAAEHTGPGVGGFLNASFGNAPELIIALFAIADGLPEVVRGSLAGSVDLEPPARVRRHADRRPGGAPRPPVAAHAARARAARRCRAVRAPSCSATPAIPSGTRRSLASIPISVAAARALPRGHRPQPAPPQPSASAREAAVGAWTLPTALAVLGVATRRDGVRQRDPRPLARGFAQAVGASEFFIAAVIVAIVGNAAEHGGAIVIARAGKMKLASEIAISSSAQVALLVAPAVMLLSLLFTHALPLTFRWEELAAMAGAVVARRQLIVRDGRSSRREGWSPGRRLRGGRRRIPRRRESLIRNRSGVYGSVAGRPGRFRA